MRANRIKILEKYGFYHCICRCVGLMDLLGERRVKSSLSKMIERTADFSGIQIITYCIMDDHFHLLIQVPPRDTSIPDSELIRRFKTLYAGSPMKIGAFEEIMETRQLRKNKNIKPEPAIEELVTSLLTRMHDISEFMKTLKQRFTMWYNKKFDRIGTLWTERFKSVVIEDNPPLIASLAAYIDLNPVRAGICKDPKNYSWCGYFDFIRGLQDLKPLECNQKSSQSEQKKSFDGRFYRASVVPIICHSLSLSEEEKTSLTVIKEAVNTNSTQFLQNTHIPINAFLKGRIRYLSDGLVLGSKAFLQHILARLGKYTVPDFYQIPVLRSHEFLEEGSILYIYRRLKGKKLE